MDPAVDKVAFGGLRELNSTAIDIRQEQINYGHRLHSCLFYGDSLNVIKIASKNLGKIPRMSTKVYYNFRGNSSFKGIHNDVYDQLNLIVEKIGFIPQDWHIQVCNVTDVHIFEGSKFQYFREKVETNFGNVFLCVESFIAFEKEIIKAVEGKYIDGISYRDSAFESQSSQNFRDYLNKNSVKFSTYSGLSSSFNALNSSFSSRFPFNDEEVIKKRLELNMRFLKSQFQNKNFMYCVVSVSSLGNFYDLTSRLRSQKMLTIEHDGFIEDSRNESYKKLRWIDDYGAIKKPSFEFFYLKHLIKLMLNKILDVMDGKSWG